MIGKPQIIKVAENIWCVRRRSYLVCSYIVKTGDKCVLVDTSMKTDGADTLFALDHLGIPVESVSHILLTHWHNDHSAATKSIVELSGCSVYIHERDQKYLESGKKVAIRQKLANLVPELGVFVLLKGLVQETVPNPISAECLTSSLPDGFAAVYTPGHTEGHTVYYHEESKALFSGDALASVDGKVRLMSRPVTLDVEQATASAISCLEMDFDYFCPGHRSPVIEGFEVSKNELLQALRNEDFRWPVFG